MQNYNKNSATTQPLAIVAGRGNLPQMLIDACKKRGQKFKLFLMEGEDYENDYSIFAPTLLKYGSVEFFLNSLKENNLKNLVFIGAINKPNFSAIKVDKKGAILLAKILANKILGDDAVLRTVIKFLEKEGLKFLAIEDLLDCVISKKTTLTKLQASQSSLEDIELGVRAIKSFSAFDVGQALIVAQKQIIAVEALEGTDEMIKRCSQLNFPYKEKSVLIKMKKFNQSTKADLPTIGVKTIENCAAAKISGIAIQANSTLVLNKEEVIAKADELGLFLVVI